MKYCTSNLEYDSYVALQTFIRRSCQLLQYVTINGTDDSIKNTNIEQVLAVGRKAHGSNMCEMYQFSQSSRSTEETLNFIVGVYVVSIVCALGFVGNCLSIAVSLRLDNRVVGLLFISLAAADNVVLISCFCLYPLKVIMVTPARRQSTIGYYYPYVVQAMWPVASAAQLTVVVIVVLITVDRYLALCQPFSTCRMNTRRQAAGTVLSLVLAACAFNVPRCFEYTVSHEYRCHVNAVLPALIESGLLLNRTYFLVYNLLLYAVVLYFVPLCLIAALNVRLIFSLTAARRQSMALVSNTITTVQPTAAFQSYSRLLITMITAFVICGLPDSLLRLWHGLLLTRDEQNLSTYLNIISYLMITVNSAINCLIYSVAGRQFRAVLIQLACGWCRSRTTETGRTTDVIELKSRNAV